MTAAVSTEPTRALGAVVLAGGRSSRMGRDKAFLELHGRPLVAWQVDRCRAAGAAEVVVVGRAGVDYGLPPAAARVTVDEVPDRGPLEGMATGLGWLGHRSFPVLVLAVDLPAMSAEVLLRLRALCCADRGVVARVEGRLQPLAGWYPSTCLSLARDLIASGRLALRDLVERAEAEGRVRVVDLPAADAPWFRNWNTPGDHQADLAAGGLATGPSRPPDPQSSIR